MLRANTTASSTAIANMPITLRVVSVEVVVFVVVVVGKSVVDVVVLVE